MSKPTFAISFIIFPLAFINGSVYKS
jgi:hypothetical protein